MSQSQASAVQAVIVEEEISFSFEELCRVCGAEREGLLLLIQEGVVQPIGDDPASWSFEGRSLRRARAALRLARDLDLGPSGTALVLDLLEQIAELQAKLRRAGL